MADQVISVKFRVSDDGTLQVIDSAGKKIETLGTTATAAASKIGRDLGLALAGIGTAAALAARQLTQLVTSQAAQVEQLGRMSQQLGVGIREMSSFAVAAQVSGASMESFVRGVAFLGRAIASNSPLLKELGVTSRDSGTALGQLADAFQKLPDGPEKTAVAFRLLGRGGLEMIPILNAGSKSLREMQQWAERLGLTLSQDVADQFMQFDDTVDLVHASVQGLRLAIARELLPVAQQIAEAMLAWVEANRALVATSVAEWATAAGSGFLTIANAISSIGSAWNAIPSDLRPILLGAAVGSRYGLPGAVVGAGAGAIFGANQEIQAETARINAEWAARRAFEAGGISSMDWEGTSPVDWGTIGAGRGGLSPGLAALLGGRGRKKAGGAGGTDEAEEQAKRLLELGKQNLDQLEALREAESLRAVTAAQAAEFELQAAQQRGASYDELIAKAQALDEASNRAYQTEIENLQKQRAAAVGGGEMALIDAQIAAKEQERIQKIGAAVRAVSDEWRKQREVIVDLSATFESSFARVIDGVLNSAGKFDLAEITRNTMRTMLSELASGFIKAQLVKQEGFDVPMGTNFKVTLPGFVKTGVDAIGSLWSEGMGAMTATTAQAAGSVQASLAQVAASPYWSSGGMYAPGAGYGMTAIEGANIAVPYGAAGGALPGQSAGLSAGINWSRVGQYAGAGAIGYTGGSVINSLAGFGQTQYGQYGGMAGGLAGGIGGGVLAGAVFGGSAAGPIGAAIGAAAGLVLGSFLGDLLSPKKTGGPLNREKVQEFLKDAGVPMAYKEVVIPGMVGLNGELIDKTLWQGGTPAYAEPNVRRGKSLFTDIGLSSTQMYTKGDEQGDAWNDFLVERAQAQPGVNQMRVGESLAVAGVVTTNQKDMVQWSNAFTNNMLALGLSAEQAHDWLLDVAEAAGVDLVSSLRNANENLIEGDLTLASYKATVDGAIKLFKDDLPAGVDATRIALDNVWEGTDIINLRAFNRELEEQTALWSQVWSTIESGVSGALKQYAETVSSLPSIEQVLSGTGDITQLIQRTNATLTLKEQMRDSLRSAVIEAMTEGLMATIKDSSLWKRMEAGIQLQITGQGSFNATQFVNLLLQKYGGAIDAIATAAVAMNAISEQAAAKVAALDTTAQQESLRERATQVRFGIMRPRQQQAWLSGRIASTESDLAGIRAGGVLDDELVKYQKKLGLQAANYEQMIALGSQIGGRRGRALQERGAAGLDALADAWKELPDINKEIHDTVVDIRNSIPDIPEAISQGWKDFITKVMGGEGGDITSLIKEVRAQTKVTMYENYSAKGGGLEDVDISKYTFLKANDAPVNDILAYLRTGEMPGNYGAAWASTQGAGYRPKLGPPTGGLTPAGAGRSASGDRVQQIDIEVNVEGGSSPGESADRIGAAIVTALRTNPAVRQEVQRIAVNG